jgi:hypothetical protein
MDLLQTLDDYLVKKLLDEDTREVIEEIHSMLFLNFYKGVQLDKFSLEVISIYQRYLKSEYPSKLRLV